MANRKTISISITPEIDGKLNAILEEDSYMSKSELFRDMFRVWEDSKIRFQVENSRKEIAGKKTRVLKSLKDLK